MKDTKDFSVCVANLEKNVRPWEMQLQERPDPASFREAVAGLRTALDQLGRAGFLKLAQASETTARDRGSRGHRVSLQAVGRQAVVDPLGQSLGVAAAVSTRSRSPVGWRWMRTAVWRAALWCLNWSA